MNTTEPTRPSCVDLPLEIRSKIFAFHFTTSTGYITNSDNAKRHTLGRLFYTVKPSSYYPI